MLDEQLQQFLFLLAYSRVLILWMDYITYVVYGGRLGCLQSEVLINEPVCFVII